MKKKKGRQKIEYIFSSLFQFNKGVFDKASEEISNLDIPWEIEVWKEKAEQEYTLLIEKIHTIEDKIESYTEQDMKQLVKELRNTYTTLLTKVQEIASELDEKYDLEKKVALVKQQIDKLQKYSKKL